MKHIFPPMNTWILLHCDFDHLIGSRSLIPIMVHIYLHKKKYKIKASISRNKKIAFLAQIKMINNREKHIQVKSSDIVN